MYILCCTVLTVHVTLTLTELQDAAEIEPVDSFARPSGNMLMRRKGDRDDDGGWGGGGGKRGGGGGGGWGGKASSGKGGKGGYGQEPCRGKALKSGSYGEVAGRTFAVLEVRMRDLGVIHQMYMEYRVQLQVCVKSLVASSLRPAVRCPGWPA